MLTREQMEQVLARGGSVLHQGRIISRAQDLPSAAELAAGDENQETQVANALQQQIDELHAQLAKLQPAAKPSGKSGSKPEKEDK